MFFQKREYDNKKNDKAFIVSNDIVNLLKKLAFIPPVTTQ
jgi:hypothetical protein